MPLKTYTTFPAFISNSLGGLEADPKGVTWNAGDTISGDEAGPITIKTSQANIDILEANGYAE